MAACRWQPTGGVGRTLPPDTLAGNKPFLARVTSAFDVPALAMENQVKLSRSKLRHADSGSSAPHLLMTARHWPLAVVNASVVLHTVRHIKPRLCPRGRVANPRNATGHCCGLHLATRAHPSIFLSASQHATPH
jgi:hypothetical protein